MAFVVVDLLSNAHEVSRSFSKTGRVYKGIGKALAAVAKDSAKEWRGKMRNNQFVKYTGKTRRTKLQSRSGSMKRSISIKSTGRGWNRVMTLKAGGAGVVAQEFGMAIRAKPGSWLNIPAPWTLDSTGARVRASYQIFGGPGNWHTRFGPTWTKSISEETAHVYGRVGAKKVQVLRILRKSVVIPGPNMDGSPSRLGFLRTWKTLRKRRATQFRKIIRQHTQKRVATSVGKFGA